MEPTFRLLRVRGIPVGAHWTWPVAFAVVAWTLARSVFPSAYPGLGTGAHLLMAVAATAPAVRVGGAPRAGPRGGRPPGGDAGRPGSPCGCWAGCPTWAGRPAPRARSCGWRPPGPAVSLVLAGALADGVGRGRAPRLAGGRARRPRVRGPPQPGGGRLQPDPGPAPRRRADPAGVAVAPPGRPAGRHPLGRPGRARPSASPWWSSASSNLWAGARLLGVGLVVLGGFLRAGGVVRAGRRPHPPPTSSGLTAADVMASDPGVVLNDTPVARLVEHPPTPERTGYPVLGGGRLLGVVVLASARRVRPRRAGRPPGGGRHDAPRRHPHGRRRRSRPRRRSTGSTAATPPGRWSWSTTVASSASSTRTTSPAPSTAPRRARRPAPPAPGRAAEAGPCGRAGEGRRRGHRVAGTGSGLAAGGGGVPRHRGRAVPAAYVVVAPGPVVDVTGDVSVAGVADHPAARPLPGPERRAPAHERPRGPRRRGPGRPPARARGRGRGRPCEPTTRRCPGRPGSWPRRPPPAPRACRRR